MIVRMLILVFTAKNGMNILENGVITPVNIANIRSDDLDVSVNFFIDIQKVDYTNDSLPFLPPLECLLEPILIDTARTISFVS